MFIYGLVSIACRLQCRRLSTHAFRETIYALSSGHGKCGVAVIRVSGTQTEHIVKKMGSFKEPPQPRQALLRTFVDPKSLEMLDRGLVLWFPAPHSFTGEDCAEFQVHGGVAVISSVLRTLDSFDNARPAQPGEFTMRAFLNGKLQLTEVEGLADVIHAETEQQRRQAVRQMSGELHQLYSKWRQLMIQCMAYVEAHIDFSEEENIEDDVIDKVKVTLGDMKAILEKHLLDGRRGERLRSGIHVTILGPPNVGKSSLLNYLTRRPLAIVSETAGTTRDVIESAVDLGGYPIVLVDTAGLRQTNDLIEEEGVRRAINRSQEADLIILMIDCTSLSEGAEANMSRSYQQQIADRVEALILEHLQPVDADNQINCEPAVGKGDRSIVVLVNKLDQCEDNSQRFEQVHYVDINSMGVRAPVVFTSLTRNQGLDLMIKTLTSVVKDCCGNPTAGNPSFTQSRHRAHVTRALGHITESIAHLEEGNVLFCAESLRHCASEIGRLTGSVSSEDVLDALFKDFCIGK